MSGMRTRTSACRRLRDIADLESQRDFVQCSGGACDVALHFAAACCLFGFCDPSSHHIAEESRAASSRACFSFTMHSLLDFSKSPEAARLCSTNLFLLFWFAALAFVRQRAPDIPRGRECAAKILASLAGVEAHATTMVDSGAVLDLAAALSGPEQRWAALALRVEARKAVIPVHAALVELLKLEITPAARVAATEALGFLAEDEEMRLHLRREAAVFLRGLSSQAAVFLQKSS
eukprot:g3119.t1